MANRKKLLIILLVCGGLIALCSFLSLPTLAWLNAWRAETMFYESYETKATMRISMTTEDWVLEFGGRLGLDHIERLSQRPDISGEGKALLRRIKTYIDADLQLESMEKFKEQADFPSSLYWNYVYGKNKKS